MPTQLFSQHLKALRLAGVPEANLIYMQRLAQEADRLRASWLLDLVDTEAVERPINKFWEWCDASLITRWHR